MIYHILNILSINLIKKIPYFVLFLLFSRYVKNPMLYIIFGYISLYWVGIIICIILNIFILYLFKKIYFFLKLNEIIISLFFLVLDFFSYSPVLENCLYSIITIPYSNYDSMLAQAKVIKDTARRASFKASCNKRECEEQIGASTAICEAIPNGNNVWNQIFYSHLKKYRSDLEFWKFKKAEADAVSQRVVDETITRYGAGRSLTIYVNFIT